jgi:hypothetical protein
VAPPERLHRIGFSDDLSAFATWQWQRGEGRWDDPAIADLREEIAASFPLDMDDLIDLDARVDELFAHGIASRPEHTRPFRVLYTATTRRAAFVEVLQDFRRSDGPLTNNLRAELARMKQDATEIPRESTSGRGSGIVPIDHFQGRYAGDLTVDHCKFADFEAHQSVQFLRPPLLRAAQLLGLVDVNRGSLLSNVREFTRLASGWLFKNVPGLAGIRNYSTLGQPHENWSIYEFRTHSRDPIVLHRGGSSAVDLGDPELQCALEDLSLEIH